MSNMNRRVFIGIFAKFSAAFVFATKIFAQPIETTDITAENQTPDLPQTANSLSLSESTPKDEMMFSHGFASVASVPLGAHLYRK